MSAEAEKRERRLALLEDHIGRSLALSEANGELRSARGYGKPLDLGDGYDETPAELRMGFKILKDAGVVPAEVELMREIEGLRQRLAQASDETVALPTRRRLSELQQQLALGLERLRMSGAP
jgi:DNA-binding transcriptional ArsR family regulator